MMKSLVSILALILVLSCFTALAEAAEPELEPLYPEGNVAFAYDAENNPTSVTEIEFFGNTIPLPMTEPYDPYIKAYTVENPIYSVIFFPGSGYFHMNSFEIEGVDIARKMNEYNISCFVCAYRVSPSDYHAILADGQRAVRYVRYHADDYGIDPDKIAIFGFSAGGQLTLYTCEDPDREVDDPNYVPDEIDQVSAMPNAILLGYPGVSWKKGLAFEPGAAVFFNGEPEDEMRAKFSTEDFIPDNMVPTFIWLCADDPLVPNANSLILAEKLAEKKIPYEVHVFQAGGHGSGLSEGTPCEPWFDLSVAFIQRLAAPEAE